MGEGNHLAATGSIGQPKGRWMWVVGGTAAAVLVGGLLMQYVRSSATKAAQDAPAGQARVASGEKNREILAKVAGESITYDAVADECVKRYGREVLEDLIHRLVIQKACEKRKVSVTQQEISEEISRIAKRFNLEVNQWLQMLQAERNISPAQYRDSVIFPMVALKKLSAEEIDISEEEMKEAFIRDYGPRVKARMIMCNKMRIAQEVYDKLRENPKSFEKLASEYSIDPSSRALEGQIPPIPRFSGNEKIEDCAFKLKENGISGILEVAPERFVILKSEGRTEPVVSDLNEVRDALYETLKESKVQAAVAKVFDQIKKETIVDNYLTQTSNRTERSTSAGSNSGVQPVSGTKTNSATKAPSTANAPDKTSRK